KHVRTANLRAWTAPQDNVVTKLTHLVGSAVTFQLNVYLSETRQPRAQGVKERRIDQQLLFSLHRGRDTPHEFFAATFIAGPVAFHRRAKELSQWKRSHVTEEDRAAVRNRFERGLENIKQILDAGKVLNDGVENNRIEDLLVVHERRNCIATTQRDVF